MNATPAFSFVVPTYNGGRFIEETLSSVLVQTFCDFEIVVVDDGSTDDTQEKLRRHFSEQIILIRQSNQGPEAARNAGIECAQGEYIVSLDADDVLYPHALEVYSKVIDRLHHPPLILGKMTYFSGQTRAGDSTWVGKAVRCSEFPCFFKKSDTVDVSNSNIVVRREVLNNVHGYQLNSYYDDHCLLFKMGTESPLVAINYPATVAHRYHDTNFSFDLEVLVRGAAVICASERSGLYPGGSALKTDRRGLIASNVAEVVRWHLLRNRGSRKLQNLRATLRMILSVRSFFLHGLIRLSRKRTYFKKEHEFFV